MTKKRQYVARKADDPVIDMSGATLDDLNPEIQEHLQKGALEFFEKNNPKLHAIMERVKKEHSASEV